MSLKDKLDASPEIFPNVVKIIIFDGLHHSWRLYGTHPSNDCHSSNINTVSMSSIRNLYEFNLILKYIFKERRRDAKLQLFRYFDLLSLDFELAERPGFKLDFVSVEHLDELVYRIF